MGGNSMVNEVEAILEQAREQDAPLSVRLAFLAQSLGSRNPRYTEAVERLIARLNAVAACDTVIRVGDTMPDFGLPDEAGRIVTLRGLCERGPVVISFNRGHWCPYCRLHMAAMAEAYGDIKAAGGQLVAIVPERQKFAAAMRAAADAPFPVLSDIDNGYALSLNLVIWLGLEIIALLSAGGRDLPAYQGNSAWMLPIPTTFVVTAGGVITARYIDPDFRRRMETDALINELRQAGAVQTESNRPSAAD